MSVYEIERTVAVDIDNRSVESSWRAHAPVPIEADSWDVALRRYCEEYLTGALRASYENYVIRVQMFGVTMFQGLACETGYLRSLKEDKVAYELAIDRHRAEVDQFDTRELEQRPD